MSERVKSSQSLSVDDKRQFEAAIARFEAAWHDQGEPDIARFLPVEGPMRAVLLEELVQIDLEFRRGRGEQLGEARYHRQFPELAAIRSAAASRAADASEAGSASRPGTDASQAGKDVPGQRTITRSQESTGGSIANDQKPENSSIPESFGRYRILKALGQGAMGAVYLAQDTQLDRKVALKIPKFVGAERAELLERFYREARSAAMLRHPNICPVHDVGEIDGQHYITMAFIEGRLLKEFARGKKPQPERKVAAVIRKLAEGLAEAHGLGVIHRDLKPANIMIDAKGEPVVMDFGLARRTSADEVQVTHSGAIIGTPAYMSPEQVEGDQKKIGPAADIYSLGVIFYELLTGKLPFEGALLSILQQIAVNDPTPPSQVRVGVDPRLEALCLKMMSKRIANRPQSMKEVAQSLTEYLKSPSKPVSGETGIASATESPPGTNQPLSELFASVQSETPQPVLKTLDKSTHSAQEQPSLVVQAAERIRRLPPTTQKAVASGLLVACVLLAVVLFLRLGNVDVKVVIDDASLAVKFDKQTVTFEGSGSAIKLRPGEHKFIVERDGLEAETDSFTVKKDGKNVLEVSIVNGKVVVSKEGQPPAAGQAVAKSKRKQRDSTGWHGWPKDAPPPAIAPFDAAQAKKHQEAWAKYLGVPVEYTNSIGMKFRLIPPGEFLMGSTPAEIEEELKGVGNDTFSQDRIKSQAPPHKVALTQPIYLGVHEVTQRQYQEVMGNNPSHFTSLGPGKDAVAGMDTTSHPVETVSWNDAAEFCTKLSVREKWKATKYELSSGESVKTAGTGYRLPTEAEWEYSCRAGTITKYWIGDKVEDLMRTGWSKMNSGGRTHDVGELTANPFGLYDIHGNVWEWVQDWWDPTSYEQFKEKDAINPNGPPTGTNRMARGGDWGITASVCGAANRADAAPWHIHASIGFRVSLSVDAVKSAVAERATKPAIARFGWHGWPKDAPPPAIAPFDAAQAKKHQEAWAKYLGVPVEYTNSIGMKFRLIPPGEFMMGSTQAEIHESLKHIGAKDHHWQACIQSEGPRHKVILTRPIYLSVHEVTQAEYEKVMEKNPSWFAKTSHEKQWAASVAGLDTSLHPVEGVTWNDAAKFCAKLSEQEKLMPLNFHNGEMLTMSDAGAGYRLPTEAEWEFACRAGTTTKYWFGDKDEDLLQAGWFGTNSGRRTHPVGELKANPFGFYDVHGNVWEWVQDWRAATYYGDFQENDAINPSGPSSAGSERVIRGGECTIDAPRCRAACRDAYTPSNHIGTIGFRTALTVDVQTGRRENAATIWHPTPAFQQWMQDVAALPAEQQVDAVVKKLQELNPGYDGKVLIREFAADGVWQLQIATDQLTDISPLAALRSLTRLNLNGSELAKGQLRNLGPLSALSLSELGVSQNPDLNDLTPLRGMPLIGVRCNNTSVSDLTPLRGMKLRSLHCIGTPMFDLTPLQGMPLVELEAYYTKVRDVSPLANCKSLIDLRVHTTLVSDLSPLKDLKLTFLDVGRTDVRDISPLSGMPLRLLDISATKVTDLSPLRECPLTTLSCDFVPARDTEILQSIKSLVTINRLSAAEFWKKVDSPAPMPPAAPKPASAVLLNPAPGSAETLPAKFTNSLGVEFVLVGKGTAWLGGGNGQPGTKQVEIPHDFYLGAYEVTQGEWEQVTGLTPSHFSRTGGGKDAVKDIPDADLKRFPVEQVSWDDAQAFLVSLNQREMSAGWIYRLPKEAEWEYACRGGPLSDRTESAYSFYFDKPTNQLRPDQANFSSERGAGLQRTCKVGSYQPNRLGLYDLHGNVWEWCDDADQAPGPAGNRVDRGGSLGDPSGYCGAAFRGGIASSTRAAALGLRLARVPVGFNGK